VIITGESNIVSFSGGKDSTALLLMMLEKNIPVDDVVFFDTGWEFPQMHDHIAKVEKYTGVTVMKLHPKIPFTELMLNNHRTRGKRTKIKGGYGWPTPLARWCTNCKIQTIDKHCKQYDNPKHYIGIAADEAHRCKQYDYPLVEWGITEKDALEYCKSHGFDWGGLYEHFDRVSCFCCPLQGLRVLRNLRRYYPEQWNELVLMDLAVNRNCESQTRFRADYSIPQLEQRFRDEDRQLKLFGDGL